MKKLLFTTLISLTACQTTVDPPATSAPPAPDVASMTCNQLSAERKLLREQADLYSKTSSRSEFSPVSQMIANPMIANPAASYAAGYSYGAQIRKDREAAALRMRFAEVSRMMIEKNF